MTAMTRRWLPYPLLSGLLAVTWLVLNQSLSPGMVLLALLFGATVGKAYGVLRPPKARVRNYRIAARLFVQVVHDIIRSNIAVARIILGGAREQVRSGFVAIPLELDDRHGLAVLACIITSTPGTVWVSYDPGANLLLIHVLDLVDEQDWIDTIQLRYERPLLEIFQ